MGKVNTRLPRRPRPTLCGNEETYYQPLTSVEMPAGFTERASSRASGSSDWEATGQRSAFIGTPYRVLNLDLSRKGRNDLCFRPFSFDRAANLSPDQKAAPNSYMRKNSCFWEHFCTSFR